MVAIDRIGRGIGLAVMLGAAPALLAWGPALAQTDSSTTAAQDSGSTAGPLQPTSPLAMAVELRLDSEFDTPKGAYEHDEFLAIRKFYAGRVFEPLWVDAGGLKPAGRQLVAVLRDAYENGLEPTDYDVGGIEALTEAGDDGGKAHLEYILSRAAVRYATDLHSGRLNPQEVDKELFVYPRVTDPLKILVDVAASEDVSSFMASLAPTAREYRRLKNALSAYQGLASLGGWSPLPDGETLKPGMTDPRVPLVRKRLIQVGDYTGAASDSQLFDEELEQAVIRFQYRHGLDQDGAIGKMTRAAFNVPVEDRIDQMLLNMERRRWMATDPGDTYVFVNMADFELKVVDGPKTIHDTRVVVGKPYHRTPVFSGEMTYLVLNPYWNIPPSIARNEILPKVKQDVSYLTSRNIRVFSDWSGSGKELDPHSINWSSVSKKGFSYKLRQDAGDGNALGQVKFMFPNRFNVYLHDTQAKNLFSKTVRSFSHGCIRVQYPIDLAEVVLRNDPDWSREKIDAILASGKRTIVRLKKPMNVHLTYLTSWVNKDGTVHFRNDIYDRDKRLATALFASRKTVTQ